MTLATHLSATHLSSSQLKSSQPRITMIREWPKSQKILMMALWVLSMMMVGCGGFWGGDQNRSPRSDFLATSIEDPAVGDLERCDLVYTDSYRVLTPLFRDVVSLWDRESGEVRASVTDPTARRLVNRTVTWLQNMMGSSDHPVHPVAFLSVIIDFESSTTLRWSGGGSGCDGKRFRYTGSLCDGGLCLGLFQINLGSYKDAYKGHYILGEQYGDVITDGFARTCGGPGGLGILGKEGSLEMCSALYWWLALTKCSQLRSGRAVGKNACTAPGFYWTPDTFAYTYHDVYVQANQHGGYDIGRPWVNFYRGGRFTWGPYDHDFMGYEHCAVKHFLKDVSSRGVVAVESSYLSPWLTKTPQGFVARTITAGSPRDFNDPEGKEVVRAMVSDFAEQIGLRR